MRLNVSCINTLTNDYIIMDIQTETPEPPYIEVPPRPDYNYEWINNEWVLNLTQIKNDKIQYLAQKYFIELRQGFDSSAKGVQKHYGFSEEDETLMNQVYITSRDGIIPAYWKAADEVINEIYTNEEFKQLITDASYFKIGLVNKYQTKKQQVLEATTKEQIDAIDW